LCTKFPVKYTPVLVVGVVAGAYNVGAVTDASPPAEWWAWTLACAICRRSEIDSWCYSRFKASVYIFFEVLRAEPQRAEGLAISDFLNMATLWVHSTMTPG
jgi:hypothetical protein